MVAEPIQGKPKPRPEAAETNVELSKLVEEQTSDDVVESFSRGFADDLKRILGERYVERQKRGV